MWKVAATQSFTEKTKKLETYNLAQLLLQESEVHATPTEYRSISPRYASVFVQLIAYFSLYFPKET